MGDRLVVITHFPSPYQIELFDEVERMKPDYMQVFYLHTSHHTRQWSKPAIHHRASFLDTTRDQVRFAETAVRSADAAVINFYSEAQAAALISIRASTGLPWAFWGERPGYRHGLTGRILRKWRLRALHSSSFPIWGIGRWAVDAYRDEFGGQRPYVNMPYFSDLTRFQAQQPRAAQESFTFLYSGSLSWRKGVDVLARAFARLAAKQPHVRLRIVGQGDCEREIRQHLRSCNSQVEWLGFLQWKDLPTVYSTAHALCAPSRYDGWGMIVPEGLAAGLPVISTDRTGSALEFIEKDKNGRLTCPGDEESLLEAMSRFAALSSDEWHSMSESARESVSDHTLQNGAKRFLKAADDIRQMRFE